MIRARIWLEKAREDSKFSYRGEFVEEEITANLKGSFFIEKNNKVGYNDFNMATWLLFSIMSALMASLVAIFGKLGLKNIDSTLATTIRSIVMALFLIIASFSLKKFDGFSFHSMVLKDWILIILAGIAGAMSWLFYFMALKSGNATKVVAIDRLSLVFVAILAFVFLGETLNWQEMIGVAMMVGGAIIVSVF